MAATEEQREHERREAAAQAFTSIVAAAMALPGVVHAESKPDASTVSVRALSYQDSQPGLKRVSVIAPSFQVTTNLFGTEDWWLDGGLVYDSVSGATPRYHTAVSGASRMTEKRTAGDVKVTRYFERATLSGGLVFSTERDYESLAGSLEGSWSTADQNTTLSLGLGLSEDRINPVNRAVVDEARSTWQVSLGVTQATSRTDLVQLTLAHSDGRGYYSDPYKVFDIRPRERRQNTVLVRWNHHFEEGGSTLRSSYRAYQDNFGIQAHTFGFEWVAPMTRSLKVIPSLRLYTQTAADFYSEAVYEPGLEPIPLGYPTNPPRFITQDQRLSAYGAVTLGLGLAYTLDKDWAFDGKVEAYEQRSRWAWTGDGSVGLAPMRALSVQLGLSRRF